MCERYVLPARADAEREFMPAYCWWKFTASFNVAPAQYAPAIRLHAREAEGVMMRWGLIPSWAEGEAPADRTVHATLDDIERSPIYGSPWLSGQRCILPLAGFYVWQLTPAKYRQPFFVRLRDRAAFGVAAVWDRSTKEEEDDVIESFAMLTVPANPLLTRLDSSSGEPRMPAILRRKDYALWLEGTPVKSKALVQTYPPEWMEAHAVSPRVNSPQANDAALILPVAARH